MYNISIIYKLRGDNMLQDSFSIYENSKCEIDVHINVWTDMRKIDFIDIRLRIFKKELFDKIYIYIPYTISQCDIIDLSENLKSETVIRGILNQKCSMTIIRFRLPYKSLSEYFSAKKHMYIEALESPIMREKYLYNFKINENRTLPKEVLPTNNLVTIKTISFFICMPDKYIVTNDKIHKIRIIENKIFDNYIPNKQFGKKSITYQWNYHKSVQFTLSAFLERKYINWVIIAFYSSAIIILTIISNFIFKFISIVHISKNFLS